MSNPCKVSYSLFDFSDTAFRRIAVVKLTLKLSFLVRIMNRTPYIFIMAGGSGTRLWPLSRKDKPKQVLSLYSNKSLIQETIDRAKKITRLENIFIGTNKKLKKAIMQQVPELSAKNFILEPEAKNTAPIIVYFCAWLKKQKKDLKKPIVVLSADHYISPVKNWISAVDSCFPFSDERIWCMGIRPTRAETGYGYIHLGRPISGDNLFEIQSFKEKPDARTAEEYYHSENYLWNSGMFIFTAERLLNEAEQAAPEILELAEKCVKSAAALSENFAKMPSISFDYAILENSNNLGVVKADFTWDDVGSFEALSRILPADEYENFKSETTLYYGVDAKQNILYTEGEKVKIALLGVENLVVVQHKGILFVANRKDLPRIKDLRELFPEKDK
ncbi:MAG: mannose-1-phosphate guanylyltransferase [Candidatus Hydrogenedentota bacterium]|nr:MAG: mannose-1-phosphate guanylyltransferase [Candidatus Hydrogenedentota bacterium]